MWIVNARERHGSRRRSAFTIVEMVVVLVILGLFLAFAIPALTSSDQATRDTRARGTANAALSAIFGPYAAVAGQWDDAGHVLESGPGVGTECAPVPPRPMDDTVYLMDAFPEVTFVGASVPSTHGGEASVGVELQSPQGSADPCATAGWVVGVAVASGNPPVAGTPNDGEVVDCWLVKHWMAPVVPDPNAVPLPVQTTYAVTTIDPLAGGPKCTAQRALDMDDVLDTSWTQPTSPTP